jgi:hypothetical protein
MMGNHTGSVLARPPSLRLWELFALRRFAEAKPRTPTTMNPANPLRDSARGINSGPIPHSRQGLQSGARTRSAIQSP